VKSKHYLEPDSCGELPVRGLVLSRVIEDIVEKPKPSDAVVQRGVAAPALTDAAMDDQAPDVADEGKHELVHTLNLSVSISGSHTFAAEANNPGHAPADAAGDQAPDAGDEGNYLILL